MTDTMASRRAWAFGLGLVLLLAASADTCLGQIWRMKKPKWAVEKAQQKRRRSELVRESPEWAVRFIRFRLKAGTAARTKTGNSSSLELDVQIRKKSPKAAPEFQAEWIVIAHKPKSKGKGRAGEPGLVRPTQVAKSSGESLAATFVVEPAEQVTLVFAVPVAPVSEMEARFLDLNPVPLSTIQKYAKPKR